ncbi:hypothetical protein [Marinicauda salina]|uniref:hypothetical protein n=1 Tax=Marinicauda salina TaxID=2135793 RepID=UPI001E648855|nr:hypothetical protein [Marinicauda salina]
MSDAISSLAERSGGAMRTIAAAAQSTGADFDFLVRTAARESNFDAQARASSSSAAGMFQFIEQTWLAMIHRHGAKHGYAAAAGAVRETTAGRFVVDDPEQRAAILDMRFDPRAASVMAGELAADNAAILREQTGREPGAGELYAAHFLGARGAARLINEAAANPDARADRLFPAAAAANRPIFYADGRPRSAQELLANLAGEAAAAGVGATPAPSSPEPRTPVVPAATGGGGRASGGWARSSPGELSPLLVEILASLEAPRAPERKA